MFKSECASCGKERYISVNHIDCFECRYVQEEDSNAIRDLIVNVIDNGLTPSRYDVEVAFEGRW